MARPIDADILLQEFDDMEPYEEYENEYDLWLDMRMEVLNAPTLTLPNEKLTCDGCIHEYDEHENCNYCRRAPFLSDYYHHYSPIE